MGIPKKSSRRVEVDGRPFRFLVKEVSIPNAHNQKEIQVTVQEDTARPGRPLQFRLGFGTMVTSNLVGGVIRQAYVQGWAPASRGKAFDLTNFEI